jgi:hypothetical protein
MKGGSPFICYQENIINLINGKNYGGVSTLFPFSSVKELKISDN